MDDAEILIVLLLFLTFFDFLGTIKGMQTVKYLDPLHSSNLKSEMMTRLIGNIIVIITLLVVFSLI